MRGSRQSFDTENTDIVFLRYRYCKYREIPTDTDRKIPTRYATLNFSSLLNFFVTSVGINNEISIQLGKNTRQRASPNATFRRQMTRRTMEEPSPVPVVVPTTEPPLVSPSLSRRGSHCTDTFDGSPRPQQLKKPPPPKLPAVPLDGRRRRNGR